MQERRSSVKGESLKSRGVNKNKTCKISDKYNKHRSDGQPGNAKSFDEWVGSEPFVRHKLRGKSKTAARVPKHDLHSSGRSQHEHC